MGLAWRVLCAGGLLASLSVAAHAQEADDGISAADRQAAAEAYDRGSSAYLARNYDQAARYFEMADRLAPSAAALTQAVRAHERAGNALDAANLALRLQATHGDDRAARRTAERVLSEAAPRFLRIDVDCDGCSVLVDRGVVDHPSFFVEPDVEHTVTAHFETGDVDRTVRGAAGERRELRFEAPEPPEPGPVAEPTRDPDAAMPAPAPGPREPPRDGGGGLSPAWFAVAGIATVALAGAATWSGLDAIAGVDEYEANPTQDRLEEGQSKELRTNVLIGVTAGAAALTLVLALLTDWGGSSDQEPPTASAAVGVLPGGAAAVIQGALP